MGATQLLQDTTVYKSFAAIRDAVEAPHEVFSPGEAVSALNNLGLDQALGQLNYQRFQTHFFL